MRLIYSCHANIFQSFCEDERCVDHGEPIESSSFTESGMAENGSFIVKGVSYLRTVFRTSSNSVFLIPVIVFSSSYLYLWRWGLLSGLKRMVDGVWMGGLLRYYWESSLCIEVLGRCDRAHKGIYMKQTVSMHDIETVYVELTFNLVFSFYTKKSRLYTESLASVIL